MNVLQYADDTCLVADGPSNCQRLLDRVDEWLDWTGMKAKVPKCYSLAIQASTARRYDHGLHLNGQSSPFTGNCTIKFLGGLIRVPMTNHDHKQHLTEKLNELLVKVDRVPVTRKQKLLLLLLLLCVEHTNEDAIYNNTLSYFYSVTRGSSNNEFIVWCRRAI